MMGSLRLLPALLCATIGLLTLKLVDLGTRQEVLAEMFSTSVALAQPAPEEAAAAGDAPRDPDAGTPVEIPQEGALSQSEREVLESLSQRHEELRERERTLDSREDLLKAAEQRIEERIGELKSLEAAIGGAVDEEQARRKAQVEGLVTMYETMRPKDAARIFDGLDLSVLMALAEDMEPRVMAEIMANMQAEAAQTLTARIAALESADTERADPAIENLPKIQGRPSPAN